MTAGQYLSFKHKLFKSGLHKRIYSKANDSLFLFFFRALHVLGSLLIMFKYMDYRSVQFFGPMDYFRIFLFVLEKLLRHFVIWRSAHRMDDN